MTLNSSLFALATCLCLFALTFAFPSQQTSIQAVSGNYSRALDPIFHTQVAVAGCWQGGDVRADGDIVLTDLPAANVICESGMVIHDFFSTNS